MWDRDHDGILGSRSGFKSYRAGARSQTIKPRKTRRICSPRMLAGLKETGATMLVSFVIPFTTWAVMVARLDARGELPIHG